MIKKIYNSIIFNLIFLSIICFILFIKELNILILLCGVIFILISYVFYKLKKKTKLIKN